MRRANILLRPQALNKRLADIPKSQSIFMIQSSNNSDKIENLINKTHFGLTMQEGRPVTRYTLLYNYPTSEHIDEMYDLAKRSGCCTTIGVGDESAMNASRIIQSMLRMSSSSFNDFIKDSKYPQYGTESTKNSHPNLKVPMSYGALWGCCSEAMIYFDPIENMLLPLRCHNYSSSNNTDTIVLDPDDIKHDTINIGDTLYASLALALETAVSIDMGTSSIGPSSSLESLNEVVENGLKLIKNNDNLGYAVEDVVELCVHASQLMSYGCKPVTIHGNSMMSSTSVSFAIASALLPSHFPHTKLLPFYGSLFPGILAAVQELMALEKLPLTSKVIGTYMQKSNVAGFQQWIEDHCFSKWETPSLAKFAASTPDIQTLDDRYEECKTLLDGGDDGVLGEYVNIILQNSLNK